MPTEKVLPEATLCFLRRNNQVLLAVKTKAIGKGCWNGYGGGIEGREDPKEAAVRELLEESGVVGRPEDLEEMAIVYFHNTTSNGTNFTCKVHVYGLSRWEGAVKATGEMKDPTWFGLDNLPLKTMMPADAVWLPRALNGEKFIATAHYGPFQKELLGAVSFEEVSHFKL
jgi:8-oxo-dGTP pyrophosphatase MutT (NUDIX family)